jgi:hypothetical protein
MKRTALIRGVMGFRLRERIEHSPGTVRSRHSSPMRNAAAPVSAARLSLFAEKHAAEKGCEGTWLASGFQRKDEAHLFYESLGYEKTGYRFVKKL